MMSRRSERLVLRGARLFFCGETRLLIETGLQNGLLLTPLSSCRDERCSPPSNSWVIVRRRPACLLQGTAVDWRVSCDERNGKSRASDWGLRARITASACSSPAPATRSTAMGAQLAGSVPRWATLAGLLHTLVLHSPQGRRFLSYS